MDIKENLAQNLIRYRKSLDLTQAELADKLNYSDKAVSKWERGESFPDLYVLKQIADFYEVTIDTLISEPKEPRSLSAQPFVRTKQVIISLCTIGLVWLVAICCYAFIHIIFPSFVHPWLFFIYALPVSSIVLLVLNAVWKRRILTAISISILIWTMILAIYLSFLFCLSSPPSTLWEVFLIGIPLQLLVIFWSIYRKIRRSLFAKSNSNKK